MSGSNHRAVEEQLMESENICPKFLLSPPVQQIPKGLWAEFDDAAWFNRAGQTRGAPIAEPGVKPPQLHRYFTRWVAWCS